MLLCFSNWGRGNALGEKPDVLSELEEKVGQQETQQTQQRDYLHGDAVGLLSDGLCGGCSGLLLIAGALDISLAQSAVL
jgi:hypothetical protein